MARIYITREIDPAKWTPLSEHEITSESLLDISPLEFVAPDTDWIFFYSSNGVRYFFENIPGQLIPYKWACIGPSTAETLGQYVLDIDYIGNGVPQDVALEVENILDERESVCYIRAQHSQDSIRNLLLHRNDISVPVYANELRKPTSCGPYDIVVFTSPRSAQAYMRSCDISSEKVIAIGKTTATYLRKNVMSEVFIPDVPTEDAIVDLLKSMIYG